MENEKRKKKIDRIKPGLKDHLARLGLENLLTLSTNRSDQMNSDNQQHKQDHNFPTKDANLSITQQGKQ